MKIVVHRLMMLFFLSALLWFSGCSSSPATPMILPVHFNDANLKVAVETSLGVKDPNAYDMLKLTKFEGYQKKISDLTGLEYALNLTSLSIRKNSINDIGSLADLTNLTQLSIDENSISDISPLANLTNLTILYIYSNNISNVSILTNLTSLTHINLCNNNISDVSPLSNLLNLKYLNLGGNNINNVSPLSNLVNLTGLHLNGNSIINVSPLENLVNLTSLSLYYNNIKDISPLSKLTSLKNLNLKKNLLNRESYLIWLEKIEENNPGLNMQYSQYAGKASIEVISPNGGEVFSDGKVQLIKWYSVGISEVDISYSVDNGLNLALIEKVPSIDGQDNRFSWLTPRDAANSGQLLIRISNSSDSTVSDDSDDFFTIKRGIMNESKREDNYQKDPSKEDHEGWMGIEFVTIPGGKFKMGDYHDNAPSAPVHTVTLTTFKMSKYEVTYGQYAKYLTVAMKEGLIRIAGKKMYAADDSSNSQPYMIISGPASYCPFEIINGTFIIRPKKGRSMMNDPVTKVSWYGAKAFSEYYGYRLPTEAEWEYAARGGQHLPYRRFPWGDTINHSNANYSAKGIAFSYDTSPHSSSRYHPDWYDKRSPYTSPVGAFPPNGYGLYDMDGNIREWCSDWYNQIYYKNSTATNPTGPTKGMGRVVRGGSWSHQAYSCRVANRKWNGPGVCSYHNGFRPVMDVP